MGLALAVLAAPGSAVAMTAAEAFADGNRLFRDELYWAALLRYEQAKDAGMSSPQLHYNEGVAHYKARQYRRAAAAFRKAAESPQLEVISHYNLGLTAYAAGFDAEALGWFRRSRDQERSRKIRRLSIRAIERIREDAERDAMDQEAEAPVIVSTGPERELERDPRPFSDFDFYARAGFGSDDNVFRTPAAAYTDQSDPNNPVVVDPVVQSGSFVPVSLGAKYLVNSFEHESFFARYRGSGHFYPDEELENANEFSNELAIGTEYRNDREGRQNRVFSAFTLAQHEETYFDPDDGLSRTVNGIDIGDRLSYIRYGPEISTRQSWERFSFSLWGKAQLWNYENAEEVPEYDHEYFRVGGNVQYRFTQTSMLRFVGEIYQRHFSSRPSFELDGTQPLGTPAVVYGHQRYGVLARQRVTRNFWFGVSYMRTTRDDQYLEYNDYIRDGYGAEFHFRLGNRFRLDANALYRIYNYSNAFAFHNPAAGRKTLETGDAKIRATFDMKWNLRLVGEYTYREVASNDLRIAYDRSLFLLSLQWDNE